MKKPTTIILHIFILSAFLLASCGGAATQGPPTNPTPAPTNPPPPTQPPPTNTLEPTATNTPIPTDTPIPTATNTPTVTPTLSPDIMTFAAGEPIRIGYLLWETHPLGVDSKRGIELAIKDFGGEIFGHPVELTGYDEECNLLAGQRGAQILALDPSVVGILGTSCSAAAQNASKVVSDKGKVMLSPSNTVAELTLPDRHDPGYFRIVPSDIFAARAAAKFAFESLGLSKMAVVFEANHLAMKSQAEVLCTAFTDLGGECTLERTYEPGATYFTPTINAMVEAEIEAVYFMGFDPNIANIFITESKAAPGLQDMAYFVWEQYNNPEFLRAVGENAIGVFTSVITLDFAHDNPAYQKMLEDYKSTYGEEPPFPFHAFAYDAAMVLLNAIRQAAYQQADGSLIIDLQGLRAALYNLVGYQGLTGILTCNEFGDCATGVRGAVFQYTDSNPDTFNPGPKEQLSSNPQQVYP